MSVEACYIPLAGQQDEPIRIKDQLVDEGKHVTIRNRKNDKNYYFKYIKITQPLEERSCLLGSFLCATLFAAITSVCAFIVGADAKGLGVSAGVSATVGGTGTGILIHRRNKEMRRLNAAMESGQRVYEVSQLSCDPASDGTALVHRIGLCVENQLTDQFLLRSAFEFNQ